MGGGDRVGPSFNRGALNFNGVSALTTHQMMMMGVTAHSIHRFAIFTKNDVDLPGCAERLKGAVHGGEPHAVAAILEVLVDFLRRAEIIKFNEGCSDCGALSR